MTASLLPALRADDPSRAERGCVFGQFGAAINFTDGRFVYFLYPREPFHEGLFQYTLMPMHMRTYFEEIEFEGADTIDTLQFTRGYPVWRLPVHPDARANMVRRYPLLDPRTVLFDLDSDPENSVRPSTVPARRRASAARSCACCASTRRRPRSSSATGWPGPYPHERRSTAGALPVSAEHPVRARSLVAQVHSFHRVAL